MTAKKTPGPTPFSSMIARLVARALRERDRGGLYYNMAADSLQKAISLGLKVDDHIEVIRRDRDGKRCVETFTLADNFTGDAAFRNTRIPHFELKKVPKKAIPCPVRGSAGAIRT